MVITSHAVCAPIVKINPDGSIRIARMTYTDSEGRTSIRHIMESGKNGQSVKKTFYDGVFSEGRDPSSKVFVMKALSLEPVLIELLPDEYHYGDLHLKVAFPVDVPEQYLRRVEAVDQDDPDESHGPIKMVSVEDWLREASGTVPFHVRVTKAVLIWAATTNPRVLDRYYDVIRGFRKRELTDEQKNALAVYPKGW